MKITARTITTAAIVAAAYATLTMVLAPISYGPAQFRVSEALCVLPFFMPAASWGLFAGCALANVMGGYGILDVVFGSLATLLAALCSQRLGRSVRESGKAPSLPLSILSCAMPVVFNGPIIGAVIALSIAPGEGFFQAMLMIGTQIAIEEAAVLFLLGLPLMQILPRVNAVRSFWVC